MSDAGPVKQTSLGARVYFTRDMELGGGDVKRTIKAGTFGIVVPGYGSTFVGVCLDAALNDTVYVPPNVLMFYHHTAVKFTVPAKVDVAVVEAVGVCADHPLTAEIMTGEKSSFNQIRMLACDRQNTRMSAWMPLSKAKAWLEDFLAHAEPYLKARRPVIPKVIFVQGVAPRHDDIADSARLVFMAVLERYPTITMEELTERFRNGDIRSYYR